MKISYWEYDQLTRRKNVIVIGAGIVGLSAAIELAKARPNWNITVVDKETLGCAASTRNAGFACFGTVSEIVSDWSTYGHERTHDLIQMRRKGLELLLSTYDADDIGYTRCGGAELFRRDEDGAPYIDRVEEVNSFIGEDIFHIKKKNVVHRISEHTIYNPQEGYLHTGKLYDTIVRSAQQHGVQILRGVHVNNVDDRQVNVTIKDEELTMSADQVLIASNALTAQYFPSVDIHPVRNQVLVTRPIQDLGVRGTYHLDTGYIYFRDIGGDRLLIGGARQHHPAEDTPEHGHNEKNIQYLTTFLQEYMLPDAYRDLSMDQIVEHTWSGILSGGEMRTPIVNRHDNSMVVAVRLGGIGVAIGVEIGAQAADLILK